ncbi:MAG: 16S rRNA methyltransferase [Desulfurococcaceae archaeon TW002]
MSLVKMVIAEAPLELVPREICNHAAVIKSAKLRNKKPTEILLDKSVHYHAMKNLPDSVKRGRPDIVHVTLLEIMSSPLNIEGKLQVFVHTYGDYVIEVNPETRIPRNYNRFVSLIEQLFKEGVVPPKAKKPLLRMYPSTITSLLKMLGVSGLILLDEKGVPTSPKKICEEALRRGLPIVIGGFPHGEFSNEVVANSVATYSIYHKPLDAWTVASIIVHACEELLKIIL